MPHRCQRMERFLETCILFCLSNQPSYGYQLLEHLGPFGFTAETLNLGTLYRTLRGMEEMGLVDSQWVNSDQGPRRRVYTLTPDGKGVLEEQIVLIQYNKKRLETLLAAYEQSITTENGGN